VKGKIVEVVFVHFSLQSLLLLALASKQQQQQEEEDGGEVKAMCIRK